MWLCEKIYPKVGWYYKSNPHFNLVTKKKRLFQKRIKTLEALT